MNRWLPGLAGALLLGSTLLAGAQDKSAAKKLYCWEENGRKVCGDALPASAVDSAREELSGRSGLRVGQLDRAPTDEERAALAAEQRRLKAEAEAAAAAQRRDQALAGSYESEEELRRAYRLRHELIDETIKSSQLALSNLHQSLVRLLELAGERELTGKPVAKPMAENIGRQRSQYVELQAGHRLQLQERAEVEREMEDALVRYREMKGTKPEAVSAAGQQPRG